MCFMSQIDQEENIIKLDKKDKEILKLLKANSRISYQQIAKKIKK